MTDRAESQMLMGHAKQEVMSEVLLFITILVMRLVQTIGNLIGTLAVPLKT